ncbi:MAG: RidA family protein [Acidimicrobiia bacterium]|nr:RidA family protein [Acidimicrobiia bacterium]
MQRRDNRPGGYAYLPAIPPYSGGVLALEGFEIVHVSVRGAVPWRAGFELVDRTIAAAGRPPVALCSVALRCPAPHSFDGFAAFNAEYRAQLDERGILIDGENPVARTNVAPVVRPPADTTLAAFGFTVPRPASAAARPSFVVAGAGDLRNQELRAEAIVAAGDSSSAGLRSKVDQVLTTMGARLAGLGASWADVDVVDVYTAVGLDVDTATHLNEAVGVASACGLRWYLAHPPIEGLTFEMDLRGGTAERSV